MYAAIGAMAPKIVAFFQCSPADVNDVSSLVIAMTKLISAPTKQMTLMAKNVNAGIRTVG